MSARVEGHCPACGRDTLFLGEGGYVTCGWIDERDPCPDPGAAGELLDLAAEQHHIVQLSEGDFTLQHPLRERLDGDLWECSLHQRIAALDGPPAAPGRYRVREGERLSWELLP